MKTRKCTKCGEEKPETTEYFYRNKNCRAGLSTICKSCTNEASRRWQAENPEKEREAFRRWLAENPEKAREASRRRINTLAPKFLIDLISAKYSIDRSENGDELINAKRRELKYYRQLQTLKNQQNETK